MGWCRGYWVYGASSLAIDPSRWQLLLVSQIPTHSLERKCSVICLHFFSVSLRTWIVTLRIHKWLQCHKSPLLFLGCVSILFYIRLSVNPLSSPVNGCFEARWPVANVGVHPYIGSTESRLTSTELPYSVDLLRIIFFFMCKDVGRRLRISVFHGSITSFFLRLLTCKN